MIRKPLITRNTSTPTKPPGSRECGVEQQHQQDRDAAEALDIGAKKGSRAVLCPQLGIVRQSHVSLGRHGRGCVHRASPGGGTFARRLVAGVGRICTVVSDSGDT